MSQTGTFTVFVVVGSLAVIGTALRYAVLHRYRRRRRQTRVELEGVLPGVAEQILAEQALIIRVWAASLAQVAMNIGVAVIFMLSITQPSLQRQGWFTALSYWYLGTYYIGELVIWNVVAGADLYQGRPR